MTGGGEGAQIPAGPLHRRAGRATALGFGDYAKRSGLNVWACALLPDQVHLVVGRLAMLVERLVIQLKGDAT